MVNAKIVGQDSISVIENAGKYSLPDEVILIYADGFMRKAKAEWETVDALNDNIYTLETSNPDSEIAPRFGIWTRESSEEWIRYDWDEEVCLNAIGLIFFDDNGGTRAPAAYSVEYMTEEGKWEEVSGISKAENKLMYENVTVFDTVETTAIRVIMKKGSYAGVGVLEWKVY